MMLALTAGAFLLVTWIATKGLFFFRQKARLIQSFHSKRARQGLAKRPCNKENQRYERANVRLDWSGPIGEEQKPLHCAPM
jgi:hypothetical protein